MNKKVSSIVFDLGNVLLDVHHDRVIQAFENLGISNITEELSEPSSDTSKTLKSLELGELSDADFRDYVRKKAASEGLTDQAIDAAWNAMLGDISKENLELLIDLQDHYDLYLLSNTSEIHRKNFEERYNLSLLFKKTFYSHKMHKAKPDPAIFEEVIAETGLNPAETLFIDDLTENIQTAKELGFIAFQFDKNRLSLVNLLKLF